MDTIESRRIAIENFTKDLIALTEKHMCKVHVHHSKLGELRAMLELPGTHVTVQYFGTVKSGMSDEQREEHLNKIASIVREGMMPLPKFGPEQPFFTSPQLMVEND